MLDAQAVEYYYRHTVLFSPSHLYLPYLLTSQRCLGRGGQGNPMAFLVEKGGGRRGSTGRSSVLDLQPQKNSRAQPPFSWAAGRMWTASRRCNRTPN